jgi:hypothetical protein
LLGALKGSKPQERCCRRERQGRVEWFFEEESKLKSGRKSFD